MYTIHVYMYPTGTKVLMNKYLFTCTRVLGNRNLSIIDYCVGLHFIIQIKGYLQHATGD